MISQIRLVTREHCSARSIKVNYFIFRGNTRNQYILDCLIFYNSSQFIVFYSDVNMEFRAINYQRRTFVTGGHNVLNITKATKLTMSQVLVKTRANVGKFHIKGIRK